MAQESLVSIVRTHGGLPVALSACAMGMGLFIGWWLTVIGIGSIMISVIGMVTEYEKPISNSSH